MKEIPDHVIRGVRKGLLRTGSVAYCLGVSPRTASLLIDHGLIRGYRVKNHRYCPVGALLSYMTENRIPIPSYLQESKSDMWVNTDNPLSIGHYDALISVLRGEIPQTLYLGDLEGIASVLGLIKQLDHLCSYVLDIVVILSPGQNPENIDKVLDKRVIRRHRIQIRQLTEMVK